MGINLYSVNPTNTLKQRQNWRHFEDDILNAFSCMVIAVFLQICFRSSHWFKWCICTGQTTSHYLTSDNSVYWRICASLGLSHLMCIWLACNLMLSCRSDLCDLFSIFPCFCSLPMSIWKDCPRLSRSMIPIDGYTRPVPDNNTTQITQTEWQNPGVYFIYCLN